MKFFLACVAIYSRCDPMRAILWRCHAPSGLDRQILELTASDHQICAYR